MPLASNPVFHARAKNNEIDVHFIREKVAAKELDVQYVPTEHQAEDVLTKALTIPRCQFLCNKLTLVSPRFSLREAVES